MNKNKYKGMFQPAITRKIVYENIEIIDNEGNKTAFEKQADDLTFGENFISFNVFEKTKSGDIGFNFYCFNKDNVKQINYTAKRITVNV